MKWMKKRVAGLLLAGLVAVAFGTGAVAEGGNVSDFEALYPLMDLVGAAVMTATDEPQSVPTGDGTLSAEFVAALFRQGATADASLGIPADALTNTESQKAFLESAFAAQLPALTPVAEGEPFNGYIGFMPVTVNTAAESGSIQIIGELYWAEQPLRGQVEKEYEKVQWLERGIFTFASDSQAMNGFRLTSFSAGTDLSLEQALQDYTDEILVEYVNTGLGFQLQYPSLFGDELLVEDSDGVSATMADGSASFFAKRMGNDNSVNLEDYVNGIAGGITGASAKIYAGFQYGTVTYTTQEGFTVFDMYIVTDKYIYQAELSYKSDLAGQYSMYTTYLENTFNVEEVSVG